MELVVLSLYFYNHRNIAAVKNLWSDPQPNMSLFYAASDSTSSEATFRCVRRKTGYGIINDRVLNSESGDYAHAVHELNKAIDRTEALCSNDFPSDAMQNRLSPPH
jgi:hypothetical protein